MSDPNPSQENLSSDLTTSQQSERSPVQPAPPLAMVETAFLASTASLIYFINFYFPLGPLLRIFFAIPVAIVYLRWGARAGQDRSGEAAGLRRRSPASDRRRSITRNGMAAAIALDYFDRLGYTFRWNWILFPFLVDVDLVGTRPLGLFNRRSNGVGGMAL